MDGYSSYSAACPMCGYEHDFATKRAMDAEWKSWTHPLERAMDGLSIALTEGDKDLLRTAVGVPQMAATMREP